MTQKEKTRRYKKRKKSPEVYGLNLARDEEVTALYRSGLTLQQIGNKYGITRSRIQQIVFRTLRRKIVSEIRHRLRTNPDRMPIKILVKEEIKRIRNTKREKWLKTKLIEKAEKGIVPEKFTSELKFASALGLPIEIIREFAPDLITVIKNNKTTGYGGRKWSRHYLRCRMCGTISVPHKMWGCCENCYYKTENFKEIQAASRLRNLHRWLPKQRKYQLEHYDKVNYGGNRKKVLDRDGYKCIKCSVTEEESIERYDERLRVVHLGAIENNELDNLATFCRNCWMKQLRKRRTIKQTDTQNRQSPAIR
jgi:5-methylcytosine-specific restriction endonuclease McrA